MSVITSDLQNNSRNAINFTLNAVSTGTSVVRSSLESVAETISSQLGDNLNLFVFENRSDQAFVTSLAWGVSCAALQPNPISTSLGTLLVNGFVSTSKKDVINEIKSMGSYVAKELRKRLLSEGESIDAESDEALSIKYPERIEELKADRIMSCFHQKVSTEMAHINVFATALLSLIGSVELSVFSSDVASNLLYGVLGTTLCANAYHFVCRRSLN